MLPSFGKLFKLQEIDSNSLGNVFGSTVRITGRYMGLRFINLRACLLSTFEHLSHFISILFSLFHFQAPGPDQARAQSH